MHGMNISRYFILCTVRMSSCEIGHAILDLRRSLRKRKIEVGDMFHAVTDTNVIRTEVFNLIAGFKLDIDATLLDKPKAEPQTRPDEATFYRYAWFYHAKYLTKKVFPKKNGISPRKEPDSSMGEEIGSKRAAVIPLPQLSGRRTTDINISRPFDPDAATRKATSSKGISWAQRPGQGGRAD